MTTKILVVDDDPEIVSFLRRGLIYEGYEVDVAGDGGQALDLVRKNKPDLVILDIMMPVLDGIEVSKRIRQAGELPVLLLTAKGAVADRVAGLDAGADDYLVKPFSFDELLARIRVLLRRNRKPEGETLHFADLMLNSTTREVKRGDRALELTAQEFDLLELFMRHPHQVLQRNTIYEAVWGYDFEGESNVIEVYVHYLRTRLEATGSSRLIHTVRGVGYVLKE